jgi:hypothetical protein
MTSNVPNESRGAKDANQFGALTDDAADELQKPKG